jgi:beta-lactamase class A/LysM repeat protein
VARRIVWLLILVVVTASLVGGRTLVASATLEGQHRVKPGETLGEIARSLGVSVDRLMALNDLSDPDAIAAGRVLKVPPGPKTIGRAAASGQQPTAGYLVRPGDTVTSIALTLGVDPGDLIEANQLVDPDRLIAGQRLKVPTATVGPSPSFRSAGGAADGGAGALFERLAVRYAVDPALVKAMAWLAGGGRPSPLAGPQSLGLLQVAPATFEYVARSIVHRELDPDSAHDQAEAGIAYLAAMLRWASDGSEARALAGFIQGPGSVQAAGVHPATEQQVQAILALRSQLRGSLRAVTPTPTDPGGSLTERVSAAARAAGGAGARVGVAGRDLVTGQRIALAASETFPAASVAKLWILTELYRQHHAGTRPLTEATRADLERMIVVSDNEAANQLMELVGVRGVNGTMAMLGLAATRLANQFGAARLSNGLINQTTPSDMLRWMELLAADEMVSPTASREIRTLLFKAGDASKLRRGLPPEARLAHKSGWFDGVANDVGLVYHDQSAYALAVFTVGIADPESANATIAAIARTVHAAWGPR